MRGMFPWFKSFYQSCRIYGPTPRTDMAWVIGISLVLLLLRMFYVARVSPYGLAPDEAQYWTWLTHNNLSFLTKPPLTTWLIGLSTGLLGDTKLGVKLFALLGQTIVGIMGYALAHMAVENTYKRLAGWMAFGVLCTVPLISAGGLIMSPDAILMPLWLAAMVAVARAVRPGVSDAQALCLSRWLIVGALVGLGGLAKYSAAAFYPLLMVWMVLFRPQWFSQRRMWLSVGAGALLALALQTPVILWNLQNAGAGIAHVIWQVDGGGDTRHKGLASFGEFWGSQAVVLGPVTCVLMLAAWGGLLTRLYRALRSRGFFLSGFQRPPAFSTLQNATQAELTPVMGLLLVLSLPIVASFAFLTFHGKVQANWPILGTVTGLILMAGWATARPRRVLMAVLLAGMALNSGLSTVLLNTHEFHEWGLFPIPHKNDPTKDLRGWTQMGPLLRTMLNYLDHPVVLSSRYQTLAPLSFHTEPNIRNGLEVAYINAEHRRLNAYDTWQLPDLKGRLVVYVNEMGVLPPGISAQFKACEPWHTLGVEDFGTITRRLSLWLCWGFRDILPPK